MENQSLVTTVSQPVIDLITEISNAYENLGLGPFTDQVYKELISKDIVSIEVRFKNKNEISQRPDPRIDGLYNSRIRHQNNLVFNGFEKLMPDFRKLIVGNILPAHLDSIISGVLPA
jgi:hypothetical protein